VRRWVVSSRNGRHVEAEIRRVASDYIDVWINDKTIRLGFSMTGGSMAFVLPSGNVVTPALGPAGRETEVLLNGRNLYVSEVLNGVSASRGVDPGQKRIGSNMPGRVVKVLVSEGDEVTIGQGLVILEAMKMENEVKAVGPGSVRRVLVSEGDRVNAGDDLLEFD